MVHFDIMDGNFVPNLTFGPMILKSLRKHTKLIFDAHLMVSNPSDYIKPLKDAGADIVTFQVEADSCFKETIKKIKSYKMKPGISLKPKTPLIYLKNVLNEIYLVLIMTVDPGFGGQKFVPRTLKKIKEARKIIKGSKNKVFLEVDGGINPKTAPHVIEAGADILVAGSSIFRSKNYKKTIEKLMQSSHFQRRTFSPGSWR